MLACGCRGKTGAVSLHYTALGDGPAVVLIHSTAADSRMWKAQLEALATERTVIAPDLRGYGSSALTEEPFSDARDVLVLMDELGVEQAAVVGASGGGRVALQIASFAPERVSHLVLLCADGEGVERTADLVAFAEREDELLEAGDIAGAVELNVGLWLGPEADEASRARLREMQQNAFRIQLEAGDDVHDVQLEVDLSAITAVTTVVSGRLDLDYFQAMARHLAASIAGARHVELAWAGHLPSMERPAETTALIREALTSGRAPRDRAPTRPDASTLHGGS